MMQRPIRLMLIAALFAIASAAAATQETQQVPSPSEPTTMEGCNAIATQGRAECRKRAKPGDRQRDTPCEDKVNLQQRLCMLQVLERLHPPRSSAGNDSDEPVTATQP